jgi:hypothetical protein
MVGATLRSLIYFFLSFINTLDTPFDQNGTTPLRGLSLAFSSFRRNH